MIVTVLQPDPQFVDSKVEFISREDDLYLSVYTAGKKKFIFTLKIQK